MGGSLTDFKGLGQYAECFNRERWPTTSEIVGRLEAAGLQVSENNDKITGKKL